MVAGGTPPSKTKQKPSLSLQFLFLHLPLQLKLISEYTHVHAQTTAQLKKKDLKNMGCTLATQPLQKSSQVSSSRQKYLAISSIPIQQAIFISIGFQKAQLKSTL